MGVGSFGGGEGGCGGVGLKMGGGLSGLESLVVAAREE